MKKYILLIFCVTLISLDLLASSISSKQTGSWSAATTWNAITRTGTITFTSGSASVTGSGTLFTTELAAGSIIATTGGGSVSGTVLSIIDDTHLTLTANASGNKTASYTAQVVPGSGDDVTITANQTVTIDINNAACASLSLGTNNNIATLTFAASGSPSLTVSGSVTIGNSGNTNRRGTITFTSGSLLTCSSLSLGAVSGQASTLTMTAGGTLQVGSLTAFSGTTWTPGTGTVELTATNTLPSIVFTSFYNLTIDASTTTTMSIDLTISNLLNIKGVLNLPNDAGSIAEYLQFNGSDQAGGAWGGSASSAADAFKNSTYFGTTSTGLITVNGILPVELAAFSGSVNNNVVTLKWSTATEVNNYGFDVERKSGSSAWAKIGFVAGSGNSNSPKNYSYTDQPGNGTSFSYRLKQIDNGGAYKYYDAITVSLSGSDKAQLMQNSPNPFNPSTTIKFYVPETMDVTITIYDIIGREVTRIVNSQTTAGYHIVYWNGKDRYGNAASSGVYLYRLTAGNFTETKKMNLLK